MKKSKTAKLSLEQYEAKLRKIEKQIEQMQARTMARRDQELAKLFAGSGWTPAEIAANVNIDESDVARRLLFGCFLQSMSNGSGGGFLKNLTEDQFSKLWERTDKQASEKKRFVEVVSHLEEDLSAKSSGQSSDIAKQIIKQFADGEWHNIAEIATSVGAAVDDVVTRLKNMEKRQTYGVFCESRKAGKSVKYRIVKGGGKKMDVQTLRGEVSPIISQLEEEGKKNMATMSPLTVLNLSNELKKTLDKLSK